MIPKEQGRGL